MAKACVLLTLYSSIDGRRLDEQRVCARTLRGAVRGAVIKGYKSRADFNVLPPDSPTGYYWFGRHFDHLEGDMIVREGGHFPPAKLSDELKAALERFEKKRR